ncbi:Golgi-associated RAB2 interactor protein 5A isoform X2 [Ambystoma mexicanum]|uniref:Golgi-associated RAB2 interactor protein 5A isoform X2 n=1 Tax=Ambystoma mexicanum TaxID=8296 RepID=UPI0037E84FC1
MSRSFTNKDELMTYGQDLKLFLPEMGELQSQLYEGEYDPFKYAPVFESNFVQVTKKGEAIDIHNQLTLVTLGIAATSPILPLPNVMLLARPKITNQDAKKKTNIVEHLQLSRLFPLKLVKLSISDVSMRQIKLKLASGRSFYLQLHAPPDKEDDLFQRWMRLIYLLQPTPSHIQIAKDHEFMVDTASSPAQSSKSSEDKESEQSIAIRKPGVKLKGKPSPVSEEDVQPVYQNEDDEIPRESQSSSVTAKCNHFDGSGLLFSNMANIIALQGLLLPKKVGASFSRRYLSSPWNSSSVATSGTGGWQSTISHSRRHWRTTYYPESVKNRKESDSGKKEAVEAVLSEARMVPVPIVDSSTKKNISAKVASLNNKKLKGGSLNSKKKPSASPAKKPSKLRTVIKSFSKHDSKELKKKKKSSTES